MREINFDGLVGPTHNYAGLSFGNKASLTNQGKISNPRAAALQGLGKMRTLMEMGLTQAILPPHERPFVPALRRLGFGGRDTEVVRKAFETQPELVANVSSASNMWTANAATFSPSQDTLDGRGHITPANLMAMPHRSLEADFSQRILKHIFFDEHAFKVHDPLPGHPLFGDEGAANHNRLSAHHAKSGLELFVYGRRGLGRETKPTDFPGRQTLEASEAVARRHGVKRTLFMEQNPAAIDAGAFHNDVVCVTNENVLFFHEQAFSDLKGFKDKIKKAGEDCGIDPIFIIANAKDISLEQTIKSYLFNSQLLTRPDGKMSLILPSDAREIPEVAQFVSEVISNDNPITEARYLEVRESMRNGGGPACLRLRVQLSSAEFQTIHKGVVLDFDKLSHLEIWVNQHYRDRLSPEDLGDPSLMLEARHALDELTHILDLGPIYEFQRMP
jgi:succinylarginine dihydrolase